MRRRWLAAGLAASLATALAACSGGESQTPSGPVEIEMWTWNANTQQVVDKFNETHDKIKVKHTKHPDLLTTATNMRNAIAAGQGVPCLVQGFGNLGEVPSLLSEGVIVDITEHLKPYIDQGLFHKEAPKAVEVQGKYYGIPQGASPNFMMINRAVYDQNGIAVPKTWDDIIAAGKLLKPKGVQVMNLAGEDPSTLVMLVQQAGGTWYQIENNAWKVNFLSPESVKAAGIVQQLVDNEIVANQTYKDRPALIAYFDEGKMVSLPTSTWQLANYEINFKKTMGNWEPIDLPQYADSPMFVTPAHGNATIVPKGCKNPKEATEAGVWFATHKDAIDASLDSKTGAYAWPGAIPDPSPWLDAAVPKNLFGPHRSKARDVIMKSVNAYVDPWVVGPNYTAMFKELQDQWAKAVTKQITFQQLLENMQQYTVNDLKAKGINVTG